MIPLGRTIIAISRHFFVRSNSLAVIFASSNFLGCRRKSSFAFDKILFRRAGTDADRRDFRPLPSSFDTASRFLTSGGSLFDA